eukprot:m.103909 g.103909  ORF g.103909 m.103909 type:complete len:428 (-) comp20897_c0_seq9:824-2107(-)
MIIAASFEASDPQGDARTTSTKSPPVGAACLSPQGQPPLLPLSLRLTLRVHAAPPTATTNHPQFTGTHDKAHTAQEAAVALREWVVQQKDGTVLCFNLKQFYDEHPLLKYIVKFVGTKKLAEASPGLEFVEGAHPELHQIRAVYDDAGAGQPPVPGSTTQSEPSGAACEDARIVTACVRPHPSIEVANECPADADTITDDDDDVVSAAVAAAADPVVAAVAVPPPPPRDEHQQHRWQFDADPSRHVRKLWRPPSWQTYGCHQNGLIETRRREHAADPLTNPIVQGVPGSGNNSHSTYAVNIETMTQRNEKTGFKRKVRRLPDPDSELDPMPTATKKAFQALAVSIKIELGAPLRSGGSRSPPSIDAATRVRHRVLTGHARGHRDAVGDRALNKTISDLSLYDRALADNVPSANWNDFIRRALTDKLE